jgi:hypothetical protein
LSIAADRRFDRVDLAGERFEHRINAIGNHDLAVRRT